ncbi:MAG: tRNA (adenosine(37)-N6)-threonylcarbamoyltransferase complex transferase subunit TsaD [Flavobacteriales bacterium]|nr:tRNA (adenosine(37)-N6)-threonylcarbamoyltransferase complex transferase subunit TsaD [Flavobacteriales bacterium]
MIGIISNIAINIAKSLSTFLVVLYRCLFTSVKGSKLRESLEHITILGIESSCDETSASVLRDRQVLSNYIANQDVHEQYGGVVPELASRAHQSNIVPVIDRALKDAGIALEEIDAIAYTVGPGLIGALMVGSSFAKGLSISTGKPLIEAHHMQSHVLAHFIQSPEQHEPPLPFLCLTVSGGHTQIVQVDNPLEQSVIGRTLDDAAGEAFDKAAKILGLPYPGGPLIDKHAQGGDPHRFVFPISDIPSLDYSFSGLKTAVLYFVRDHMKKDPAFIEENLSDICASVQHTIVETLLQKLRTAMERTGIRHIGIAGGVSANSLLRHRLLEFEAEGCVVYLPKFEFCTDNAAMIATYGHYKYIQQAFGSLATAPKARMPY